MIEHYTYTGRVVDVLNLRREDIDIRDIAHALSLIPRWAGATREHYSVAEHSVHVAMRLEEQECPPEVVAAGLLHDAAEAYLGDVPAPMKPHLRVQYAGDSKGYSYRELEEELLRTIWRAMGFSISDVQALAFYDVSRADEMLRNTEQRDLLSVARTPRAETCLAMTIVPWSIEEAEERFLAEARRLCPALKGEEVRDAAGG